MASFELLELELLLLDGFDELELLPLESFELVQIVLSFFDSKEFDLHEESALEVLFFLSALLLVHLSSHHLSLQNLLTMS